MPLVEHLFELRNRLAKSAIAIVVAMAAVFWFYQPVYDFLREPYCRTAVSHGHCNLYVLDVFGQFKVRLRIAGIGGVVAASPVWLYQLGAFITPALHKKEKRYAAGFLVSSLLLFALGCVFAYLTLDKGLEFLLTVGGDHVINLTGLQSYLSFVTLTLLAFGVAFEFPVIVVFLNVVGVLSVERLVAMRRGMIVGLAVFSAVITPSTDPFTFFAMAIPLWILYEVCIVIARVRRRGARRRAGDDPDADLSDDEASHIDTTPSPL
ncbi:MAG: Sec-independent protein translocase, TatC subunit [Frankiales bacterium]|nr:Sec-independent protein translocase, TatC subunit [Frankiales bacterium]